MKSIATTRLLARTDASSSFLPLLRARAAWLGVLGCGLGVACAPTDDADRKFDIAQSHADTDEDGTDDAGTKDDDGTGTKSSNTHSDGTTGQITNDSGAGHNDDSDVGETSEDDSDDEDVTDDSYEDTDDDTSDEVSQGTDTTDDDGSDDGGTDTSDVSADTTDDDTSDVSEDTSADITDDTTDPGSTSEDTTSVSEDASDDETSDDEEPVLTSAIADLVWTTGGLGTGPGLFEDPRFVAADQAGNVYVAEYESEGATRVQVFDAEGEFVAQWLTHDTSIVTGMAGTLDGHLFILQGGTVGHYEGATGDYLGIVSFEGSADAIAVAPDGGLVVVNSDRILRLSKDGTIVYDNPSIAGTTLGDTIFINGAAVDGSGNVFVIDTFEVAVFKFNPSGNFADQMGVEGEGPGFLEAAPDAITTDRFGRIYIADWDGIEVLEPGGGYAGFIDLTGAIFGMATNIDDELFILERNYGQLYKLKLTE